MSRQTREGVTAQAVFCSVPSLRPLPTLPLPPSGAVCSAHVDRPFCSDAVRAMNLTAGERGITFSASVAQLKQAKKQVCVD